MYYLIVCAIQIVSSRLHLLLLMINIIIIIQNIFFFANVCSNVIYTYDTKPVSLK